MLIFSTQYELNFKNTGSYICHNGMEGTFSLDPVCFINTYIFKLTVYQFVTQVFCHKFVVFEHNLDKITMTSLGLFSELN